MISYDDKSSYFINNLLKSLNYDVISYNSSNIRNKSAIELITKNNISDMNVFSMLTGKQKKMIILVGIYNHFLNFRLP